MTLKWERHTEFFTLTLMVPRDPDGKLWPEPPPLLEALLMPCREQVVSATLLLVEAANRWAGSPRTMASRAPRAPGWPTARPRCGATSASPPRASTACR